MLYPAYILTNTETQQPDFSSPENDRGPPNTATEEIRLASPLEMTCRDGDTIAELQQPEQKAAKLCTGDLGA